jgi:hydrogenase/urease accessory protein HupE
MLAGLALLGLPSYAHAHATGLSFLDVQVEGARVKAALDLPAPELVQPLDLDVNRNGVLDAADVASRQAALTEFLGRSLHIFGDGRPCAAEPDSSELRDDAVLTIRAAYRCPESPKELHLTVDFSDAIGDGYSTFVQLRSGPVSKQAVLNAKSPFASFAVQDPGQRGTRQKIGQYVAMGMEHIFTGYDHILFLIALLMLGGRLSRIIGVATAFTAAHTLTLSLAVLSKAHLNPRFVESTIAASIAYVAVENFWHARPVPLGQTEPAVLRWRWAITFAFGLVHGFGLSSALTELGLPHAELPLALGCFNLGVELGQVVIIAATYPVLAWAGRQEWYRPDGVRYASVGVFGLAVYWFMIRAFTG